MARLIAAAALSTFLLAPTLALAEDPADWSGFYAGINGGYANEHVGVVFEASGTPYDQYAFQFDPQGSLVGLTAGFGAQVGMLVFGVEGDIARGTISGPAAPLNFGGQDAILTSTIDWLGTLRGRVGVGFDAVLVYATAGLAAGGIGGHVTNYPTDGTSSTTGGTQYGYVVGGGVEVAVTDALSLKAEYLYVDLGRGDYSLPPIVAGTNVTARIVRMGLNYGF